MKKILALVGSPRHGGNTDLLVEAAIAGAAAAGAEVEKVFLADLTINPCIGCEYCREHNGRCFRDDAMQDLYPRIREADGYIIGTPVYWWGPSAQLKLFLDRWYAFLGDENFSFAGKKLALICPMGDSEPETARHVVGMFTDALEYLQIEFTGQLVVTASGRGEVAKNPAALAEARDLGFHIATF